MKILLCAATMGELSPVNEHFNLSKENYKQVNNFELKYILTGAGILNCSFFLHQEIRTNKPDFVINAGIAGAIDPSIKIGEVVKIESECLGDFGAEDGKDFIPAAQIGLMNNDDFPFSKGMIASSSQDFLPELATLKSCAGVTVQKVHGDETSIANLKKIFPLAQVESMEGASAYYICKMLGIPCIGIRSISNFVEKRDRDSWQIEPAIKSLNDFLIKMFSL